MTNRKKQGPCALTACFVDAKALGLCGTHYARYRRGGLPDYEPVRRHKGYTALASAGPKFCGFATCGRWAEANGHCATHSEQIKRGVTLTPIRTESRAEKGCKVDGCTRPHEAHGYCGTHYQHAIGRGEIVVGGRQLQRRKDGYARIFLPGHPNAQKTGHVFEHIAVMGEVIGRPLFPDETVHHRNGVRDDNRPENLELWTSRHPKGQRADDVVEWAIEMLERYRPSVLATDAPQRRS